MISLFVGVAQGWLRGGLLYPGRDSYLLQFEISLQPSSETIVYSNFKDMALVTGWKSNRSCILDGSSCFSEWSAHFLNPVNADFREQDFLYIGFTLSKISYIFFYWLTATVMVKFFISIDNYHSRLTANFVTYVIQPFSVYNIFYTCILMFTYFLNIYILIMYLFIP